TGFHKCYERRFIQGGDCASEDLRRWRSHPGRDGCLRIGKSQGAIVNHTAQPEKPRAYRPVVVVTILVREDAKLDVSLLIRNELLDLVGILPEIAGCVVYFVGNHAHPRGAPEAF